MKIFSVLICFIVLFSLSINTFAQQSGKAVNVSEGIDVTNDQVNLNVMSEPLLINSLQTSPTPNELLINQNTEISNGFLNNQIKGIVRLGKFLMENLSGIVVAVIIILSKFKKRFTNKQDTINLQTPQNIVDKESNYPKPFVD